MSRREALLSAGLVFLVALMVRAWAATQITFPRPEDVAYYVGVSRNLLEGRGLTTDAIWSFQTPPLSFPRPAFEVWLPLPSLLAAVPMAIFGHTFAAAQVSSVLVGSVVAVLAWRLAADVAAARSFPPGRARTLALGTGLTAAAYLPLVLASVQPDSTMPFAMIALLACLLMARISRAGARVRDLVTLGMLLGLAALTRNEAAWLALTWVVVAWRIARRPAEGPAIDPVVAGTTVDSRFGSRFDGPFGSRFDRPFGSRFDRPFGVWFNRPFGQWFSLVAPVAVVAMIVFGPWAYRDWMVFGSPFPGQALTNALSLDGRDIFAWQERPTLARYLDAGLPKLLELRWIGTVHNIVSVLLYLGVPLSVVGLLGLPSLLRAPRPLRRSAEPPTVVHDPLRPLLVFSVLTFAVASLVFPVSTTWGTFLHAAGAIHVLLVISALLLLDRGILWVGARRSWTNPVAWLGPAFAIAGSFLFSAVILPGDGQGARYTAQRYQAIAAAFDGTTPGGSPSGIDLAAEPGPIISDFPIWLAEATRHHTLALPNESPESILDLAGSFDPPARLLIVDAGNQGIWPAAILTGQPGSECFIPIELPDLHDFPGALKDVLAFRIRCL